MKDNVNSIEEILHQLILNLSIEQQRKLFDILERLVLTLNEEILKREQVCSTPDKAQYVPEKKYYCYRDSLFDFPELKESIRESLYYDGILTIGEFIIYVQFSNQDLFKMNKDEWEEACKVVDKLRKYRMIKMNNRE